METAWDSWVGGARRRLGPLVHRAIGVRRWRARPPARAGRHGSAVRRHLAAGDPAAAEREARAAATAYPEHAQVQDLLIATLAHRGEAERALALCVENAARHIRRLDRLGSARRGNPGSAHRVFLSGYYKSGSSAVLDYLRGFAGVTVWAPGGELRLIKSVGGMADLATRCANQSELLPQDLVDHYLHITGQKLRMAPTGTYDGWSVVNRNSTRLFRTAGTAGYLRTCLEGFLELVTLTLRERSSAAALEGHFRTYLGRALDRAASDAGADVILLDQGINAWRLPIASLAPPSTFVIVHRDPRDQFVDAQAARERSGRPARSAREYAATYRRNRNRADRHVPEIERSHGHRAVQVGFEDFVHSPATARGLVEFLGLANRAYGRGRFDAGRARASVGKHRRLIRPDELATLVDALPEFLDERVGPTGHRR